jgi:antitoxin component YwqK of YwqJK toxin-antitoxin module
LPQARRINIRQLSFEPEMSMRPPCLTVSLLLCSFAAFAVQDCELNGEHVNPANGHTTEGKTGMMKCRERDTGMLVREQELRAGRFMGLVRYYNRDGKLEREYSVNERGNRDGLAREFSPEGRVLREETYRNGSTIGTTRTWHANGALKRIAVRAEDGRSDLAEAGFNDRGQLRELRCADRPVMGRDADDKAWCGHGAREPVVRELFSDKGELRGRVAHLDGRLTLSESVWDNGRLQEQSEIGKGGSVDRRFSREGVKRREIRWVATERGRSRELEQEFHESGTLVRERRWLAGELAAEKTWYLNGQLQSDYRYAKSEATAICDVTEYHDNGRKSREGRFTLSYGYLDRPVGPVRGFDTEGRLRREVEYDARGRVQRERELDENGVVTRDDAVFEDGSRKAFTAPPPR